jgi:hypothetical protein
MTKDAIVKISYQRAVLARALEFRDQSLKLEDLVRDLIERSEGATERDGIERAIKDLVAGQLLDRADDRVWATEAAIRFNELKPLSGKDR